METAESSTKFEAGADLFVTDNQGLAADADRDKMGEREEHGSECERQGKSP